MMKYREFPALVLIALIAAALACSQAPTTAAPSATPAPTSAAIAAGPSAANTAVSTSATITAEPTSGTTVIPLSGSPILIGTEYILTDNPSRTGALAELLAPIGLPMAKPLPEPFSWGKMQTSPDAPIDFGRLDVFVREFQEAGFSDFLIALKSASLWGSRDSSALITLNPAPKPEYMAAYEGWISSVVERYDADGFADMPGLVNPIRYYEIGSEFSSYEPEPVAEYLETLEHAYAAAHRADENVMVAHAAFLTTLAFAGNPGPAEYEAAFGEVPDPSHNLADIRRILDRPDLFDVVNVHSLGDPYEIEAIVAWLDFEMSQRGYQRGIMISDTGTTPFVAWGPATACDRDPTAMGRIIPPAIEADRCRLADYFNRLVAGDVNTLRWTQSFVAEDVVKKVMVSAEQGILLINTAFTEDLFWQKLPLFQAGAGSSAWAGLVDVERREHRASFYALQQLIRHLDGYERVARLTLDDQGIRVYEVADPQQTIWIAWYDPGRLILPDDPVPETVVQLELGALPITVESLITQFGQTTPDRTVLSPDGDFITLTLTPRPVFIYPEG